MIGWKQSLQVPPRVLNKYGEQKHDASASLTSDDSKKVLALAPMVLIVFPPLLLARRNPAQRRT